MAAAYPLPWALGREGRIDHKAHLGGYCTGLIAGFVLAPSLTQAMARYKQSIFDEMSDRVCEECGPSSVTAERAILRYLLQMPALQRRSVLQGWELDLRRSKLRERMPPDTELWHKASHARSIIEDLDSRLKRVTGGL